MRPNVRNPEMLLLVLTATLVVISAGLGIYVWLSLRWLVAETRQDRYFALPLTERRAFKAQVKNRARLFIPIAALVSRMAPRPKPQKFRGVAFNRMNCPRETFEAATRYQPDSGDIFVATQMKCGTTWMQQVVYEVLSHGKGDLSDSGHRHMYALSPWIESIGSVSMEDAPRVAGTGKRIIKTHFSTKLCPYSEDARYIYVTRHPVSCYASCLDFLSFLAGPFAPSRDQWLDIYCSDDMWWQSWPVHVAGWWDWSIERKNVLFIHYEDMLSDLGAQVDRVAAFLDTPLTSEERSEVVHKSGFKYMKENEEVFEMTPPSFFSFGTQGGSFLASGNADRDKDARPAERERIVAFCRQQLADSSYPLDRFYPDVSG